MFGSYRLGLKASLSFKEKPKSQKSFALFVSCLMELEMFCGSHFKMAAVEEIYAIS